MSDRVRGAVERVDAVSWGPLARWLGEVLADPSRFDRDTLIEVIESMSPAPGPDSPAPPVSTPTRAAGCHVVSLLDRRCPRCEVPWGAHLFASRAWQCPPCTLEPDCAQPVHVRDCPAPWIRADEREYHRFPDAAEIQRRREQFVALCGFGS